MNKKIKILVSVILIILLWAGVAICTTDGLDIYINPIEKSEQFKRWEQLPEEERERTIAPIISNVNLSDEVKTSTYNSLLSLKATANDAKYNFAETTKMDVKDQKATGACWAFSYSSAIEACMAKQKGSNTTVPISPMHVDYRTAKMYSRTVGDGGNLLMALAYGANGYGPVRESDLPFDSVYGKENTGSKYYLKDISEVELNQEPIGKIKDMNLYSLNSTSSAEKQALRAKIKENIVKSGAVMATMFVDFGTTSEGYIVSANGYYNTEKNAYYCNNSSELFNHGVTIVGWDDNFDKNNFAQGKQPSNNGAWIVLNSYGSSFGDNGIFYVSYEDCTIATQALGVSDIVDYSTQNKDYDNMYQHDELGVSVELPFTQSVMVANSFNAKTNGQKGKVEYINEVGIELLSASGVEIYVSPEGNFNNLTEVASYTGSNALEAGYRTIKLSTPLKITGDKFIVAAKYTTADNNYVPVECDVKENGITQVSTGWDSVTSNRGESYVSPNNGKNWVDMMDVQVGNSTLKNTNACIKAFTVEQEDKDVAVTGITLDKKEYSLTQGSTGNLVATITPENATNKNVIWKSSNEKVATISNTGIIKALSVGTTTITATSQDGGFTATCKVTVNKKTDNSDDKYIPSDDDDTGNGGSNGSLTKTSTKDSTTANKILPYTGIFGALIVIMTVAGISVVMFIKAKKYKDIK